MKNKPDLDGWVAPDGAMTPAGYIIMRHSVRLNRPTKAFEKWIKRMPNEYRRHVLGQPEQGSDVADENMIAVLKDYRSLMPLAHEANKPIFKLTPAEGALGSHFQAAQEAGTDFRMVANAIMNRVGKWDAFS